MKKAVYSFSLLVLVVLLTVGITLTAFTDKAKILGATFSIGSADIKLLDIIGGGTDSTNLLEEKQGPVFSSISSNWTEDYSVQIYNSALTDVHLTSNAYYETANDPAELRQITFVEPFEWNDINSDGIVDEGELGATYGRKTIIKWKTEGYDLGVLPAGTVKSLVLRFSTDLVSETKQGTSAIFDFEFSSIGL